MITLENLSRYQAKDLDIVVKYKIPTEKKNGGILSFLIWNKRTSEGNSVGSGVYTWMVRYLFSNGRVLLKVYKQGIAKGIEPAIDCAL